MSYEDTYRIRQLNDIRVQHELQSISSFKKCLKDSDDSTNKMTNMLTNFETRLNALHDLIVPIYETTSSLQIKYSSSYNGFSIWNQLVFSTNLSFLQK